MSALGTKRTSACALPMSAYQKDPPGGHYEKRDNRSWRFARTRGYTA